MTGRSARGSSAAVLGMVVVAALSLVLLAGCLGGAEPASGDGSTSATSADGPPPVAGGDPAGGSAVGKPGTSAAHAQAAAAVSDAALARREVVHTADLVVQVTEVPKAVADVEAIAERAGGYVAESLTTGDRSSGDGSAQESRLRLRVPPAAYEETLSALARLGTVESRSRSAEDKTSEVVDVDSRVADQRASVTRVRQLMGRARTLADVVALEAELSRREAELGSLLARQAALRSQTQLATITLTLRDADDAVATKPGFVAGLRGGWAAFGTAVGWLLTAVGAALPFLVALALLAVPARLLWRRRSPSRPTPEQSGSG